MQINTLESHLNYIQITNRPPQKHQTKKNCKTILTRFSCGKCVSLPLSLTLFTLCGWLPITIIIYPDSHCSLTPWIFSHVYFLFNSFSLGYKFATAHSSLYFALKQANERKKGPEAFILFKCIRPSPSPKHKAIEQAKSYRKTMFLTSFIRKCLYVSKSFSFSPCFEGVCV